MQVKIEDGTQPPAPMTESLSSVEVGTSTILANEQQPSPSQKNDKAEQAPVSRTKESASFEKRGGEAQSSNSTKKQYSGGSEILKPQQRTLRWRKDAPNNKNLVPWAYNGERTLLTLFLRHYYACRIECIRWLQPSGQHQKNVVRVYLEAWGEWDLRHPSSSTFRMFSPTSGFGAFQRGGESMGPLQRILGVARELF